MNGTLHLGSPFGIGLYVHWTFGLLVAFLLMFGGAGLGGVLFILALFGCVTLHEYGHALAARRYGIGTHSVTLYPIGGIARLEGLPRSSKEELVIALAGPAVNVAIAAVLAPFALAAPGAGFGGASAVPGMAGGFLFQLLVANLYLVAFNLIPAFPMDGGRVFRALLGKSMTYERATRIAARTGQGFALLFGVAGLFVFNNPLLLIIAFFIFSAAGAELRFVEQAAAAAAAGWHLPGIPGGGGRSRTEPPPIPPSARIEDPDWEVLPPVAPPRRPRSGWESRASARW